MARLKWEYKDKVIRFSASHEGQESEFYIDPRLVTYLTEGKKIYDFQVYVQKGQTDPYVFVGKFTDMTVEEVKAAIKRIDQAAAKGVLHKNTASRKKSALDKKLNAGA